MSRGWNVVALAYAVAATCLAWRLGELLPFLAVVAGLVLAAAAGIWWLTVTLPARHALEIGQRCPSSSTAAPDRPAGSPSPSTVARPGLPLVLQPQAEEPSR